MSDEGRPRHEARAAEPGCTAPRGAPPSAAGDFEPYGARVRLRPTTRELQAGPFLEALLEEVAASCVEAGASVIGHLKCFLRTGDGHLRCSLTSLRSGATCRGDGAPEVAPGSKAELDLAVLVYGLPASTIDRLVEDTLGRLLSPMAVSWSKNASFHVPGEAE